MWRHRKRSSKFKEAKLNQVQFCFSAVKLLKSFFFLDIVSRYSLQFISAKSWEISMKENQNLFFGVFCFSCFLFKHLSNKNAAQMKMYWCCCHGFPVSNALITLFHCNYTHCCCIPVGFLHLSEDTWGHLVRQSRRCFLGCEKSQELYEFWQSLRVGVPIQLTGTLRFLPMNQCVCLVKKMVMFSAVFFKYATLLSVSHYSSVQFFFVHVILDAGW